MGVLHQVEWDARLRLKTCFAYLLSTVRVLPAVIAAISIVFRQLERGNCPELNPYLPQELRRRARSAGMGCPLGS